jgi:hypothetical protein
MKKLKGTFYRYDGQPASGAILTLRLSQNATVIATREEVPGGAGYRVGNTTYCADSLRSILLDENGEIPADVEIHANDELNPTETYYTIEAHWPIYPESNQETYVEKNITSMRPERPLAADDNGDEFPDERDYGGFFKIVGESPIDITKLAPEKTEPEHSYSYAAVAVPVVPRRILSAVRKPGVNYGGFVGGIIYPSTTGVCVLPSIHPDKGGQYGVCGFMLPTRAIVSRVTVNVETPQAGKRVLIALFDAASGKRRCSTSIDASNGGFATGEFESEVELGASELYMAWAGDAGVKLTSVGGSSHLFDLGNEGGGAITMGTVAVPAGITTIPERLGPISPSSSFIPPLTFFKF